MIPLSQTTCHAYEYSTIVNWFTPLTAYTSRDLTVSVVPRRSNQYLHFPESGGQRGHRRTLHLHFCRMAFTIFAEHGLKLLWSKILSNETLASLINIMQLDFVEMSVNFLAVIRFVPVHQTSVVRKSPSGRNPIWLRIL